ncbi:hypothetical protein ACFQVC_24555 [Streptomyces monticola]|uniref:DUF3618 domain-containing protein n=1 Tax=Streptomyces monticola TaxID=2666263 RepID=A0ABW2JPA5_9ACTN
MAAAMGDSGKDGQGPVRGSSGIHIHNVQGAFAIGDGNSVVHQPGADRRDPDQEELLRAVRELRADLARLVRNDQTLTLDAELERAEGEIERTGRAADGRLVRLRQALADAGAVTGLVASAAAVGQAVGALLGS